MAHTLEHKKDPQVEVNLLTLFNIKVQHLQNGLYFNVPFFNGTKRLAIKIDYTYEGSKEKIKDLRKTINSLDPEIRESNLCKIYSRNDSDLDKENNVLSGKIEIHLFNPIWENPYDNDGLLDKKRTTEYNLWRLKRFSWTEFSDEEKELYPLSEAEITKEVNMIHKYFYDLLLH